MLLKKIKLQNIRSYTNLEVVFPSGTILLAGDIGSGKSTILYAIEFALFGAKKTELPAHLLLRHGCKTGSVELFFEIDNQDYIVKRNLKRGKNGISQEAGYLIHNGVKKEGTHVELKTWMLEILGYPSDLVSKSKDLIYRYTVYTPQEEMKRILLEKKEDRLNTLRKVFNIDKYKSIRENAIIYIRTIKDKRLMYEGNIADLSDKKKELEEKKKLIVEVEGKLKEILPKVTLISESVFDKKKSILVFEKQIEELNKIKKEIEINEIKLKNHVDNRLKNNSMIEGLKEEIVVLKKDLGHKEILDDEKLKNDINETEKLIIDNEKQSKDLSNMISVLNLEIKRSNELTSKIKELNQCPICLQEVTDDHKNHIHEKEDIIIKKNSMELNSIIEEEKKINEQLITTKKNLEDHKKQLSNIAILKLKFKNIEEKEKQILNLDKSSEDIKKEVGQINLKKKELYEKLENYKDIEDKYKKEKEEYENLLKEEKEILIQKIAIEKEKENYENLIKSLDEEIKKKKEIKSKLEYISQMQNWLEKHFLNLMITIEKHVMQRVHNEFNDLFQEWFDILIEDEGISVKLDDEFTPVIEQNGYENFYENLSGGEKTSIALAYRLSLNKVINDVARGIKTKDIIMLDEPTDGFSSEQLDKMRDVLDMLNMKQVIIVSHENKIESFVDTVLRVYKEEHTSSISS